MKLHLGCGSRYIPGFTHVDIHPADHIDLVCGVDRLPAIADGAAELVYACHVLEHFHRRDTRRVLQEWYRVLKWGGTLRIAVPDLPALFELYIHDKVELSSVIGPLYGRQDDLYNVHYTGFDFKTIWNDLDSVGFRDVRKYDWRTTEHADVDDYSRSYYPHMDFNGKLLSLNVEAKKR